MTLNKKVKHLNSLV